MDSQSVVMDGMDKPLSGGCVITNRAVGIDGMNKDCIRGGERGKQDLVATVIPSIPPKNLMDFSTCSIFNAPQDFPDPIPPLGPFLTSPDIKLTEGERKLLSKDPKYSLIYPPTKMKCQQR